MTPTSGQRGNRRVLEKTDLISCHDMVVISQHDNWLNRMFDGIATGMALVFQVLAARGL